MNLMAHLGAYAPAVDAALTRLAADEIVRRIWARDHTVWKPDPREISNRLGWLDVAGRMRPELPAIEALAAALRAERYTHALLLGMGGSSLAPEVFRKTFGVSSGALDLAVLDSTDPGAVLAWADRLDLARTLFIVSTKSGGTVETFSFLSFFYTRAVEQLGRASAGPHFIAITDPGSGLAQAAQELSFRATFLNDPEIGGRFSALSLFGLVPAGLLGVDLPALIDRAERSALTDGDLCARLGTILGVLAEAGRDKLTLLLPAAIASFGDWLEQLIAESTGKEGRGILPVVGERLGAPDDYGPDRLFVQLRLADDPAQDAAVDALIQAGHPVVRLDVNDTLDLGALFFVWELATAVAGHVLQINPFDQPNVESAKVLARQMVAAYKREGRLPALTAALSADGITVFGETNAATPSDALRGFVATARPGAYLALHAYLMPTPATDAALAALQEALRRLTGCAVTVGYGPRFLHSTGQLHKGDAGRGRFIQFTAEMPRDAGIPDKAGQPEASMTFGVLKDAQALGDRQALLDAGRPVLRLHFSGDPAAALERLAAALL